MAPTFLSLPPELLLEIADYLPLDALLALRLTHSVLNNTLPPSLRPEYLSKCTRLAINTYLSPSSSSHPNFRCILCKAIYPVALFSSASSPACIPRVPDGAQPFDEVVELPERFCAWHIGRLARIVRVPPEDKNEWTSTKETMCMHCGAVKRWKPCSCNCQSCGTRDVRTYTRYLNNELECGTFKFWRRSEGSSGTEEGRLFVREISASSRGTDHSFAMDLPVHYEC